MATATKVTRQGKTDPVGEAVQKIVALNGNEREYVAKSDLELVESTYDLVRESKYNDLSDRFYWHIGELLERFAPDVEWAHIEKHYADDTNRENELAACRESIERRAAARDLFRGTREGARKEERE